MGSLILCKLEGLKKKVGKERLQNIIRDQHHASCFE